MDIYIYIYIQRETGREIRRVKSWKKNEESWLQREWEIEIERETDRQRARDTDRQTE